MKVISLVFPALPPSYDDGVAGCGDDAGNDHGTYRRAGGAAHFCKRCAIRFHPDGPTLAAKRDKSNPFDLSEIRLLSSAGPGSVGDNHTPP